MNTIASERIRKGMTQAEVARELEVDVTTVSNWETGKTMPSAQKLIVLRELFDCSTDYLLGLTEERL